MFYSSGPWTVKKLRPIVISQSVCRCQYLPPQFYILLARLNEKRSVYSTRGGSDRACIELTRWKGQTQQLITIRNQLRQIFIVQARLGIIHFYRKLSILFFATVCKFKEISKMVKIQLSRIFDFDKFPQLKVVECIFL